MVKYFPRYLITTAKHVVKIEPVIDAYLSNSSMCRKSNLYVTAFLYFTSILFRENNSLNSREGVHF